LLFKKKENYKLSTASGKRLNAFSLSLGIKQVYPVSPLLLNMELEVVAKRIQLSKGNKGTHVGK